MVNKLRALVVIATVVGLLLVAAVTFSAPPDSATVQFGNSDVGSPFPPPDEHDQSSHAKDTLVPRTVVIREGGTVTFELTGVHQVAIYEPGTGPKDIDTTETTAPGAGCPPVPLINDANNRTAVLGDQPCAGGPTSVSHTFNDPGRYLVICTFLPHFAEFEMYGWVIVK